MSPPPVLLCDAIETLEQLAAELHRVSEDGARSAEGGEQPGTAPSERRLGRELLLSIRVLLPKLRAAHYLHAVQLPPAPRACPNCDD